MYIFTRLPKLIEILISWVQISNLITVYTVEPRYKEVGYNKTLL